MLICFANENKKYLNNQNIFEIFTTLQDSRKRILYFCQHERYRVFSGPKVGEQEIAHFGGAPFLTPEKPVYLRERSLKKVHISESVQGGPPPSVCALRG